MGCFLFLLSNNSISLEPRLCPGAELRLSESSSSETLSPDCPKKMVGSDDSESRWVTAAPEFVWRSGFKLGALPFRTSLILRLKRNEIRSDAKLLRAFVLFHHKIATMQNTCVYYVVCSQAIKCSSCYQFSLSRWMISKSDLVIHWEKRRKNPWNLTLNLLRFSL